MVSFHSIPPATGKNDPQQLVPIANQPSPWQYVRADPVTARSGVRVTENRVVGHAPFFRGLKLLSDSVAGLPVNVYRKSSEGREIVDAHPAQRLLKRDASPILSSLDLISTLTAHALLHGNGFAWIERQNLRPVALWILDPSRVSVRFFENDLWYSCRMGDGQDVRFPSRSVLHIKNLSANGVIGYPILSVLAESLGLPLAAQQFGSQFYGSGCNMSGLLMVPGAHSEEKIQATLKAWRGMSDGLNQSHKVALLQDGTRFQPYSVSPEQSQFLGTRAFEVKTIANVLGLPPHLLGDDSRTSYSSLEAENRSFLTHSLAPWLDRWECEMSRKLLTEADRDRGLYIEHNREAAVEMVFSEKISGIRTQLETSLLSPNEARALLNLPAIPGGDTRYRPANWMPADAPAPAPAPAAETVPPAAETVPQAAADVAAALGKLVVSRCADKLAYEQRKVRSASHRDPTQDFCGWVADFYAGEFQMQFFPEAPGAAAVVSAYCRSSASQLLEIAGASTADSLRANVHEFTAAWDGRAERLATDITREITTGGT